MEQNRGIASHEKNQLCICKFCLRDFQGRTRRSNVCTNYDCGKKYEREKAEAQRKRVNETNRLKRAKGGEKKKVVRGKNLKQRGKI